MAVKHLIVDVYEERTDSDDTNTIYLGTCTPVCLTCHKLTGERTACLEGELAAWQLAELERIEEEEAEELAALHDAECVADREADEAEALEAAAEAAQMEAERVEARRVADGVASGAMRLRQWCAMTHNAPWVQPNAEAAEALIAAALFAADALEAARTAGTLNEAHAARAALNLACGFRRDYQAACRRGEDPAYVASRYRSRARAWERRVAA